MSMNEKSVGGEKAAAAERIGIMGGMFDPVHCGHMAAARAALDTLQLDRLYLVPCAVPGHRPAATVNAAHRLRMLELAAAADPRLVVDDREVRRDSISYTVDTLASFAQQFPDATLIFVLGWDSYHTLPQWHRWQDIFNYCHLCTVSRPGSEHPADQAVGPAARRMAQELEVRQAADVQSLFSSRAGGIFVLPGIDRDVASSELRQSQADGSMNYSLLPEPVAAYIQQHQLYS